MTWPQFLNSGKSCRHFSAIKGGDAMLTDHSMRAAQRVCRPIEQLEVRSLKSAGLGLFASQMPPSLRDSAGVRNIVAALRRHPAPMLQFVNVSTPATYISPQAGAVQVTITRDTSDGPRVVPKVPLTVNFSATLGATGSTSQTVSLPASAAEAFTPINESITFPAGVTTESVSIPINSGAIDAGTVPIQLSASSSSPDVSSASATIYLTPNPPQAPATITSARLLWSGKSATGIAISFSEPMAPASVENTSNYVVTARRKPNIADRVSYFSANLDPFAPTPAVTVPIALTAARYDAATNTVTLVPSRPLKSSGTYTISSAMPLAKHLLTNSQGNPIQGNLSSDGPQVADFAFTLKGSRTVTFTPMSPETVSTANG